MNINDSCALNILLCIEEQLQTKKSVSFNDVIASPKCRKYSVSDIGKTLEYLRKNGFVKATSRFGYSELFELNATVITKNDLKHIKKI